MTTGRLFSLAFLTVPDINPLEAVHIAADAGYQRVGLRMLPATAEESPYPIISNQSLLRDVATALDDRGLQIGDIEIIRLTPDTDVMRFMRLFESAHYLGARHVTVVNDDSITPRAIENYVKLCETASQFNLTMNLEPMPWTSTRKVSEAAHIVASSKHNNAGILVDAFHFYRSGSQLEELAAIPPGTVNIFQICDAPAAFDPDPAVIRHMARTSRKIPGHGELDLANLISLIPGTAIISIEVPNHQLIRHYPPLERAAKVLAETQRLYETRCS